MTIQLIASAAAAAAAVVVYMAISYLLFLSDVEFVIYSYCIR
jgi:hypothetical protein